MFLSTKNSYDSRKTNNGILIGLPFIGTYEVVNNYSGIYIYVKTTFNDTIGILFDNINYSNDDEKYVLSESYNVINEEKYIYIPTKLKYFRIVIITNSDPDPTGVRIVNTYYLSDLATSINYGVDASGFNHPILTDPSGKLIINSNTIDASNNSIVIYGTDNASNIYPVLTDASGKLIISNNTELTTTFPKVNTDAFGRLRISNPYTLFDSKNIEVINSKFTEYTHTGSNDTIVYDASSSIVKLISRGNPSNGHIIRESKNVFAYQPGKSLLVMLTFVMDTFDDNTTQRVGYYDDNNGIYLELNTSGIVSFNIKNNSTLTSVSQTNWNVNTLSILDITRAQILWFDIEWLGVGSVRMGFVIDGEFILCHIFHHANIVTSTYMQTAQLPIRYEIINTSTTQKTLKQICSTVMSEGGYEGSSIVRHIGILENTNSNGVSVSQSNNVTYRMLVAIRLKQTRLKSIVIPSQLAIIPQGSCVYKILLNPTMNTVTWISYDDNSAIEYTRSTTDSLIDASGGTIVNSGYVTSKETITLASSRDFNLQLGRNFNGGTNTYTSDVIAVVVANLSAGNTNAFGMIGWYEL